MFEARFPYAAQRKYTPPDATVAELRAHLARHGFERVVIVQPSPYGTDNACTLAGLKELGAAARGVAVIGEDADWPHVPRRRRSPAQVEPFEKIDNAAALGLLPANVREKILVENPARLYDF